MATAISPRKSVRASETIGSNQFSKRREVFDQHETVFLPNNNYISGSNSSIQSKPLSPQFQRSPTYSSMRDNRHEYRYYGGRERKPSDAISIGSLPPEDIDYRYKGVTERTRRISRLRSEFLKSNLHEPTSPDPFTRGGSRASLPARSRVNTYTGGSPNIFKFPFAEPFSTPPTTRKVFLDLGPLENNDTLSSVSAVSPTTTPNKSITENVTEADGTMVFNELKSKYVSPRPIDWTLPPTRPRVVSALPKDMNNVNKEIYDELESINNAPKLEIVEGTLGPKNNTSQLETNASQLDSTADEKDYVDSDKDKIATNEGAESNRSKSADNSPITKVENAQNLLNISDANHEENDTVPEMVVFMSELRSVSDGNNVASTNGPENAAIVPNSNTSSINNNHLKETQDTGDKKGKNKVKRKRSFLDKLLNRKPK